jgi:hypothetical protein
LSWIVFCATACNSLMVTFYLLSFSSVACIDQGAKRCNSDDGDYQYYLGLH